MASAPTQVLGTQRAAAVVHPLCVRVYQRGDCVGRAVIWGLQGIYLFMVRAEDDHTLGVHLFVGPGDIYSRSLPLEM